MLKRKQVAALKERQKFANIPRGNNKSIPVAQVISGPSKPPINAMKAIVDGNRPVLNKMMSNLKRV
jgi:hypothetical protein